MTARRATFLLMFLFGVTLFVLAYFFLPYCHGAKPMKCFWMLRASEVLATLYALYGVAGYVSRSMARGLAFAAAATGLAVIAVATFAIGVCPNPMMACHAVSDKVVTVAGVLMTLAAALAFKLSDRTGE